MAEALGGSRRRVPKLLIESALIVLSVLLGFAATAWHDRQQERALAAEALQSFQREITQNLRLLEKVQPQHVLLYERLDAEATTPRPGETAFQTLVRVRKEIGGTDVPLLADAAWETAASTGALRLVGYERAARLSETYRVQRGQLAQTLLRIEERASSPEDFTPASREAMLRAFSLLFQEVEGGERYLIDEYRATLPRLGPGGR